MGSNGFANNGDGSKEVNKKGRGGLTLEDVLGHVAALCMEENIVPSCRGDVLRITGKSEDALYCQGEVVRFFNVYRGEVMDETFKRVQGRYRRLAYDE